MLNTNELARGVCMENSDKKKIYLDRIRKHEAEIEWEESQIPSPLVIELRNMMNMTGEEEYEYEQELLYKEWMLDREKKASEISARKYKEIDKRERKDREIERIQYLAGIRDGAKEEAKKVVKKLSSERVKKIIEDE